MYSIGYAGYYGISMMAASYRVLTISIIAHAAQFVFLLVVENPHIEKTYNPPAPRQRSKSFSNDTMPGPNEVSSDDLTTALEATDEGATIQNIIGPQNFDPHRVIDVASVIIQVQFILLALLTPSTPVYQTLFILNAVFWRVGYSVGIGLVLDGQSRGKKWTRHFIKYGETFEEAWRQWKGIYHLSMIMSYASFIAAAWKMYHLPEDWSYGMVTLRHVLGVGLITLQIWTSYSIYESLGEFGWFFGDFFYDRKQKLTYSGIYRFLNNPERFLGVASVWGLTLITWSSAIFFLATLSHLLTLAFIQFVEIPHMEKRYGQTLRGESGLTKTVKRSLPSPLRYWQGNVDRIVDGTVDFMEEFIDQAKPKLAAGVDSFVKDYTTLFHKYPARISITRLAADLRGYSIDDYKLAVEGKKVPNVTTREKISARENDIALQRGSEALAYELPAFEYGAPLKVKWQAPANHSKRDWIGLYMVGHNDSRNITRVASSGRWITTSKGEYDDPAEQGILIADVPSFDNNGILTGEVEFSGDKLWWTTGTFEFRYHHDGKHNVMAISEPFEVAVPTFDGNDVEVDMKAGGTIRPAVEAALLPILQNCFDRDYDFAPETVEEKFGEAIERNGKYSRRVVYAIKLM
jgi:phosphatidylethanolamine N-methyltransferase